MRHLLLFLAGGCGTLAYYSDAGPADSGGEPTDPGGGEEPTGEEPLPDTCEDLDDCGKPECAPLCDADGDGAMRSDLGGDDCDDANDTVFPGADEVCDQLDNDCDEEVDGDRDGDGVDLCGDCDDDDPGRHPGIADPCGDDVDSDCDGEDCISWEDDFETPPLSGDWVVSGAVPWAISTISPHRGSSSALSGNIGDNQSSILTLTIDFPAGGAVRFWHSGSTEEQYDKLKFSIDAEERDRWSGTWDWTEQEYLVPAGIHTFEWAYVKDRSKSRGQDSVLIDDLFVEGGLPR